MRLRAAAIFLTVVLAMAACGTLRAQEFRILPRELLDSVANPVAAADSPMRFEQSRMDAGTIGEDDAPSEYVYRWRNDGERPLVITGVKTGCGCVTAAYDKNPVAAGEESTLCVTYNPKGHPGRFNRKISVYTQLSMAPSAVLELSGSVTPSEMPVHEYRHAFGPLRLKQTRVRIDGSGRSAERIEVLNAGGEELRIAADSEALPAYVRVMCEPDTIRPGAKADIEIAFDPADVGTALPEKVPVVLKGLDLPAESRTIWVYFGELPEE